MCGLSFQFGLSLSFQFGLSFVCRVCLFSFVCFEFLSPLSLLKVLRSEQEMSSSSNSVDRGRAVSLKTLHRRKQE